MRRGFGDGEQEYQGAVRLAEAVVTWAESIITGVIAHEPLANCMRDESFYRVRLLFLMEALGGMKIIYDPAVDALSIRLVEEPVESARRFD